MESNDISREDLVDMVRELNRDNKVLSDAVEKDGKWRRRGYVLIATSVILAIGVAGGVWWGYQERGNNSTLRAEVASHNTVVAQKDSRVKSLEKEIEGLKRDLGALREDREKASKSADTMKGERDDAVKDLEEARSTIRELEADQEEKLRRIGELKEEIEGLEKDLEDASSSGGSSGSGEDDFYDTYEDYDYYG